MNIVFLNLNFLFSGPVGQPNNQRLSCCLLGGECQEFVTDQATC